MKKGILFFLAISWCFSAFSYSTPGVVYGRNQMNIGFSDRDFIGFKIPAPPSPIFWSARQNPQTGVMLRFSHIFYARKYFSLGAGLSISNWKIPSQTLWAYSGFLEMRLWLLLQSQFRAYLLYSIAGPTELTHRHFGIAYFSENFLFQDYLGLGLQIGKKHAIDIEAYTVHYSNGDIFTVNSGIQIPFMLSVGLTFP